MSASSESLETRRFVVPANAGIHVLLEKNGPPPSRGRLFQNFRRQKGFTYVAVLILVATVGAIGAAYGELSSHARQREKEKELLFAGGEYRDAIESYYERTPGAFKRYPHRLADLLLDQRFPVPVRHLRRLYPDPMTGSEEWGVVKAPDGGIMGVYSLSGEIPVKSGNFSYAERAFEGAATYADWRFVYEGRSPTGLYVPVPQGTGG